MNRLLVPLILPAVLLGCLNYPDVKPPAVDPVAVSANELRTTDHVIVITDGSGTMVKQANFPEAKALTQAFVAGMPEPTARARNADTYEAGLLGFGGDERIEVSPAPFDRAHLAAWAAELHPLGGPGAGADTPIDAVLAETQGLLEGRKGRAAVVIFSDGIPDSDEAALAAGRTLVASYADGVCIHAVHTGSDAQGAAFLKRLSELSSCGSVRDGSSLDAAQIVAFERDVFLESSPLPPVAAAPDPCDRRIVLRGVEFEFDSAQLRPESEQVLEAAVAALGDQIAKCASLRVQVGGHTDAIGTEPYNDGLSNRRAAAVREFLVGAGLPSARLDAVGFGEGNPIATNDSSDGRQQNRRVELNPQY